MKAESKDEIIENFNLKPINKLEIDFQFLFKLIEFRIFLMFLNKERKEKYVNLWFDREMKRDLKSKQDLKNEKREYFMELDFYYKNIRQDEKELLLRIRQSSLHQDLLSLTRHKLSGKQLKTMENKLFLELKTWAIETDDDYLTPLIMDNIRQLAASLEMASTRFSFYYLRMGDALLLSLDNNKLNFMKDSFQRSRGWCILDVESVSVEKRSLKAKLTASCMIVSVAIIFIGILIALVADESLNVRKWAILSSAGGLFVCCALRMYSRSKTDDYTLSPLEFSTSFTILVNTVFKKMLETAYTKQPANAHHEYRLADLPTLLPILYSYTQQVEEILSATVGKSSTQKRSKLHLVSKTKMDYQKISFPPRKAQNIVKDIVDEKNNVEYIHLENNKYFKLCREDLAMLFKHKYYKEKSDVFLKCVVDTIKCDRAVDLIGEGEKKKEYKGLDNKLRLSYLRNKLRLGLKVREPNAREKDLNISQEIVSPRKLFSH